MLEVDPLKRPDMGSLSTNHMISCIRRGRFFPRLVVRRRSHEAEYDALQLLASPLYQVYSYYTHTPIQDHHASDMTRLIQTLTSLTTDEIPLILPLLRRIFTDIMSDPDLHTLTHTFITLWTRIALALHEEQVSQLLLPIMMELLEGSLAMKNYDPLMGICDREVCGRIFGCVGNLQFLKNFLPVLLEQLLAPSTPRDVSDQVSWAP